MHYAANYCDEFHYNCYTYHYADDYDDLYAVFVMHIYMVVTMVAIIFRTHA